MQLISKFGKGFRFLLCVVDIFCKYTWVMKKVKKIKIKIKMMMKIMKIMMMINKDER